MNKFLKSIGKGNAIGLTGVVGTIAGMAGMIKSKKDLVNSETEEEIEKNLKKFKNYAKFVGATAIVSGTGLIMAGTEEINNSEKLFSDEEIARLKSNINNQDKVINIAQEMAEEIIQEAEEVAETIVEETNKTVEE